MSKQKSDVRTLSPLPFGFYRSLHEGSPSGRTRCRVRVSIAFRLLPLTARNEAVASLIATSMSPLPFGFYRSLHESYQKKKGILKATSPLPFGFYRSLHGNPIGAKTMKKLSPLPFGFYRSLHLRMGINPDGIELGLHCLSAFTAHCTTRVAVGAPA